MISGHLIFRFSALALLFCLAGCGAPPPPPAPAPPEVLVAVAEPRSVEIHKEWIGTLDGSENAQIQARVTGYLIRRSYQEGALVNEGDILYEIDPRPFVAALEQARSNLLQAQAVQLATQADFERNRDLFTKKVISEKEFTNITQRNEANLAQVEAAKAGVEQAEINLKFCKITSPVEGIAGISRVQIGDLVGTPGSTTLTTVSTLDPIKILFPISERDFLITADQIQESLSRPIEERPELVELILTDGQVFPHRGRIQSVDRQVDTSTGTILVTALAENPGSILRPGLFAKARVVARTLEDAVVVPQRAVLEVQGSRQMAVIGSDGNAEVRPVKAGPAVGSEVVILSGLNAGETYVVEGIQKVRPGSPVNPRPWQAPAAAETPNPQASAPAHQNSR